MKFHFLLFCLLIFMAIPRITTSVCRQENILKELLNIRSLVDSITLVCFISRELV